MRHNRGRDSIFYNPPIVFPVQIARDLEEITPLFTGVAMDIILTESRKNQARALFKEMIENDDKAMNQLVQTIADLAEFYIFSQNLGPDHVETLLVDVGQVVVNGFLAQAVESFPNDFARYLTREQAGEVSRYLDELDRELRKAQNFARGGGRGGGGWSPRSHRDRASGGGWNRGSASRGRPSRWDEDGGVDDRNGRGREEESGRSNVWGSRARPTGGSGRASIWDDRRSRVDDNGPRASVTRQARDFEAEAEAERAARAAHQPKTTTRADRRYGGRPDPRGTIVGNMQFVPMHDDKDWPKVVDRERPWDWILLEDGRQVRPAFKADNWSVDFNPAQPRTPWYDPNHSILFYFLDPDGTVTEVPIARNATMDYLDHELDPALRQKAEDVRKKAEGKMAPTWQLVETLRPVPDSPLTTEGLVAEGEAAQPTLLSAPEEFIVTVSLADAIKRAGVRMKLEHHDKLHKPYEIYVDRAELTTVVNPDYLELYELQNATSFSHLLQLMGELSQPDLHDEVNTRITQAVNEALLKNMGLVDWSIDEFVEDIGDLMVELRKKYSEVVVQALEERAPEVISKALTYFTVEEIKGEKLSKLLDGVEDALVWRERSSVTVLPVTADELSVPNDQGVLVGETAMPAIHKTVKSIFDRTPDAPYVYANRFLVTRDNQAYQMVQGFFNEEAVLVYKTNIS